jgi:uncharacterized protein (DUF39 family)
VRNRRPRKVFAEYGKYLMKGLAQGIDGDGNTVISAARKLAEDIKKNLSDIAPKSTNLKTWAQKEAQTAQTGAVCISSKVTRSLINCLVK